MVATEGLVIYTVVVVKVNNVTCRALLDTGTGSSYASSSFLEKTEHTAGLERNQTDRNDDALSS